MKKFISDYSDILDDKDKIKFVGEIYNLRGRFLSAPYLNRLLSSVVTLETEEKIDFSLSYIKNGL